MKVTYTAPNRSHHYPYAEALHREGVLHRFVSGFSRLSPRAAIDLPAEKFRRVDFFQTLMIGAGRAGAPPGVINFLNRRSDLRLDHASYRPARESDVFLFYRTEGFDTVHRLRAEGAATRCVMEEVNSHVAYANEILGAEYARLGRKEAFRPEWDYDLRLRTYAAADYILCPSRFVVRSFLEQGFAPERLLRVNFGFKTFTAATKARSAAPGQTFRMLYVGQLHFRKGLRYALRAFADLRHPRKEFVIVGPKTEVTGLEGERIPDGVTFTGTLKGEALAEAYRSATVFVLPSLEEGLSLVQGEAMAFGLPLITTTNTGGDDLITDGVEGFVVPPADAAVLTERLQRLADDPDLVAEMGHHAREATARLGSWDTAGKNLVEALKTTL